MTRENMPPGWDDFLAAYRVGDEVTVTVTKSLPFGYLVETTHPVPGLLKGILRPQVGEAVSATITAIDTERYRISLLSA